MKCSRISFGSLNRLKGLLVIEPGSISQLAIINDKNNHVSLYLEFKLLNNKKINVHPLINTKTLSMNTEDLIKFTKSINHFPQIINFDKQELYK